MAADLAKVSLWLVTLAKDHALTFVDHALRHGDSLVGLSPKKIEAFHWDPTAPRFQAGFETMQVRDHVAKVTTLRRYIREAEENLSDRELRDLWDKAQLELGKVRLFGDLVLATYFEKGKPKEREAKRSEFASCQPSSRIGENPPYGMIGRVEETSASCEARSAPRLYPTAGARDETHVPTATAPPRTHHAPRRRDGLVASRGAGAAATDAGGWVPEPARLRAGLEGWAR